MEKFIPYEKLSQKGKRTPTTGQPENSKAYNRNKTRNWKREGEPIPGLSLFTDSDISFSF